MRKPCQPRPERSVAGLVEVQHSADDILDVQGAGPVDQIEGMAQQDRRRHYQYAKMSTSWQVLLLQGQALYLLFQIAIQCENDR